MKKRIVALLVCLMLIAGVLPLGAYADETIAAIDVAGFAAPKVGTAAQKVATALPEDAGYFVWNEGWWCDTDDEEIGYDGVFEAGKAYSYGWTLCAEEGYAFDENADVTINSGEVEADERFTGRADDDSGIFYVWTVPVDAELLDNAIFVTGFTAPVAGQTASDNLLTISLPENAPYRLSELSWVNTGNDAPISDGETFSAAYVYSLGFIVAPTEGESFGEELPAVYINGGTDLVDAQFTAFDEAGAVCFCTVAIQPRVLIDDVRIEGYEAPKVGQKVFDNVFDITTPEDVKYQIEEVDWYNYSADTYMGEQDAFASGMTYFLFIVVVPEEGYEFEEDGMKVYINGETDVIDFDYTYIGDGVIYVFTKNVSPVVSEDQVRINTVNVVGYTAPKVGQTAGENVASLAEEEDAPYRICELNWYEVNVNGEADILLAAEDVFKADVEYYLYVELTPNEGYYFDGDKTPPALFDGATDLWDEYYGTYLLQDGVNVRFFTVNVTAEKEKEDDEDPSILYGDVNSDGFVNKKDSLALRRYLADSSNPIDVDAADVFKDGAVNKKDSLKLKQYLAGWKVVLGE